MPPATIKLFLVDGEPRGLRTAEISNWSGKAVAGPRAELDRLLGRDELKGSGVYVLLGRDPASDRPLVYIGEAEVLADRLRQHRREDFWVQAIVFMSKDDNLTKAHIRYLEGRLIQQAKTADRATLKNTNESGAKLPESDREEMQIFLDKIGQLLPVLGSDVLTPISGRTRDDGPADRRLECRIKGLVAYGQRTQDGFVVLRESEAVLTPKPAAAKHCPRVLDTRERLVRDRVLVQQGDRFRFQRDQEFGSPSAAAEIIHGGSTNGLIAWKDAKGRTLKAIEGG